MPCVVLMLPVPVLHNYSRPIDLYEGSIMKSVQDTQREETFGATSRTGEPDENFIMLCTDHGVEKRRQNRIGYTGRILASPRVYAPPL